MDEQVLCFKHCGSVIFCFDLPEVCPQCKHSMSTISLDDIPFRLPYPFVRAQQQPCSIVIKSTTGTFLEHYSFKQDLHIGVTDSHSTVYEYDSTGLHQHKTEEWAQAILVYKCSEVWKIHWDQTLAILCSNLNWNSDNYDEKNLNCYSFVIAFLRELNCSEIDQFIDKDNFCEKFIFPKIVSTNDYITMYRNVKKDGFCIKNTK